MEFPALFSVSPAKLRWCLACLWILGMLTTTQGLFYTDSKDNDLPRIGRRSGGAGGGGGGRMVPSVLDREAAGEIRLLQLLTWAARNAPLEQRNAQPTTTWGDDAGAEDQLSSWLSYQMAEPSSRRRSAPISRIDESGLNFADDQLYDERR